jgi:hypothetical protein
MLVAEEIVMQAAGHGRDGVCGSMCALAPRFEAQPTATPGAYATHPKNTFKKI